MALVLAGLLYVFLFRSSAGYRVRVVGINPHAARYAGINVGRNMMIAICISGAMAGLAGAFEVAGVTRRLYQSISPGYGFEGIAVALLASNNPLGAIFSGGLFALLRSGSELLQINAQVPAGSRPGDPGDRHPPRRRLRRTARPRPLLLPVEEIPMQDFATLGLLAAMIGAAWRLATPIIFAALGEVFSERAGVLNIGIEGMMLMGAFSGFVAAFATGSIPLGLVAGILGGMALGLVFAFFAITVKADQIVVGAAINLIGLGLTAFLFRTYFVATGKGVDIAQPLALPFLTDLPFLGEALFRQNAIVYATIPAVFVAWLVMFRTSFGLTLRAVGEHPKAVDVVGRSVAAYRYGAVLIGAGLAGLGGAFLTLGHSNQFVEGIASGRGFIALAVVVFARWSPVGAFFVSLLFGLFYALQLQLQAQPAFGVPYQAFQALPYVMTIVALVLVRNRRGAPTMLGVPYNH